MGGPELAALCDTQHRATDTCRGRRPHPEPSGRSARWLLRARIRANPFAW
ncbi:MAG: hypothetical protein AVDCRST_MAG32-940 [uncultured Nocardioides sp.]|uniref:Uncharacterized protein n=1 Tax=uncultured Nocardioides sp. TaxID=198441 RepID=A0A6J4MZM4_9ACTN|nr:MAG: hypothetical protein AVDCRST_MAG32-940 [uncultured Nocardioides sp.]